MAGRVEHLRILEKTQAITPFSLFLYMLEIFHYKKILILFIYIFDHTCSLRDLSSLKKGTDSHPLQWKCRVLTTGPTRILKF